MENKVINLSYSLTKDEALHLVNKSGYLDTNKRKLAVQSCILTAASVIFLVLYYMAGNAYNILFSVVSLLLVGVLWAVPWFSRMTYAKNMALNGGEIYVRIENDRVTVTGKENSSQVLLNEKTRVLNDALMFILFTDTDEAFAIPKRAINGGDIEAAEYFLTKSTTAFKEDDK